MKKTATILLLLLSWPLLAAQVTIDNLRIWAAPDHTRLVFDTSDPVSHKLFSLKQPDRLVIDVQNALLKGNPPAVGDNPLIRRIRSAQRNDGSLRVVLDLSTVANPKSFVLKPNRQYGHRLVVDLYGQAVDGSQRAPKPVKQLENKGLRDVVIAIDAGHGGEDPGASADGGLMKRMWCSPSPASWRR